MDKLQIIEDIFTRSCAILRAGRPDILIDPRFYSIYSDSTVKTNSTVAFALVGDPKFILCYAKTNQEWRTKFAHELIAIFDQDGNSIKELELNHWTLSNILPSDYEIKGFNLYSRTNDETVTFNNITNNIQSEKLSFSDLWLMIIEVDANCKTTQEATIYLKYLLNKRSLKGNALALEEFKIKMLEKQNLIDQYKELLDKIESIVKSKDIV